MPNVRKKGKKKFQFWLAPSHAELLKEISEKMGLNMSETVRELLMRYNKDSDKENTGK